MFKPPNNKVVASPAVSSALRTISPTCSQWRSWSRSSAYILLGKLGGRQQHLLARRKPHATNGYAGVVGNFLQVDAREAGEYVQSWAFAPGEMEVRRCARIQRIQERGLGQVALGQDQHVHRVFVRQLSDLSMKGLVVDVPEQEGCHRATRNVILRTPSTLSPAAACATMIRVPLNVPSRWNAPADSSASSPLAEVRSMSTIWPAPRGRWPWARRSRRARGPRAWCGPG